MTRVAFIADTHADGSDRWDEHCRVLDWIAADMAERGVQVVGHCGDLYDGESTPSERLWIADWVQRVTGFAEMCVVAGNHDRRHDIEYLNNLHAGRQFLATEEPMVRQFRDVAIGMLPWPRVANLLAAIGRPVSQEESSAIAVDALRAILAGMFEGVSERFVGSRVLIAHAMIEGSKTDSRQPMVGVPMSVSIADLALSRADFIAVGHVHAEQDFQYGGIPIVVPGCPYHRNFGEPGPTSYVIADFEGKEVSWARIPVPARPMLLMSAEFEGNGLRWIDEDVTGAEVRLRVNVAADQREAARHAANELREELLRRGAVMVKVEEQVDASVRARAPEVATATTLEDKLRAYWKAKGIDLGDREPRVLGRLGEVMP